MFAEGDEEADSYGTTSMDLDDLEELDNEVEDLDFQEEKVKNAYLFISDCRNFLL